MRQVLGAGFCFLWMCATASVSSELPYDILDAAKRGDDHAVRKLLEQDPSLAQEVDEQGYTPLHWAGIRGYWHIFGHLLDAGAPVNAVGADGGSPLHWASHHDRPEMVARLLEAGADISLANQWGRVPLHVAARRGCLGVASLLIDAGAEIDASTRDGWTPLHVAYKAGQPRVIDLLLQRGADPERLDGAGKRPRDLAFSRPPPIQLATDTLEEYVGIYDLGPGVAFKIWREGESLRIQEFAPDGLYPIGPDAFFCVAEPWRVSFKRDASGDVSRIDVDFLRRTVTGQRRNLPRYVGSQTCRECHSGSGHGNQYLQWIQSRHAFAYWRLATDWANLLAGFRPAYRDVTDPITEKRCLLCHVTVAQDPDTLAQATYRREEGVGCETCHGPGSLYVDAAIMEDREQFLAHGGFVPDGATCKKCHRNPAGFDFDSWWAKIDHTERPEKAR